MKQFVLGALATIVLASTASAAALLPGYLHKEEGFTPYLNNTLIRFIYADFEDHTWYAAGDAKHEGGPSVHFRAEKMANGNLALATYEDKWKFNDGYVQRVIPVDADGKEGVALMLHNHFPGQTWRELIPEGPHQNQREVYTILPGRQ